MYLFIKNSIQHGPAILFVLVLVLSFYGALWVPPESFVAYLTAHSAEGIVGVAVAMMIATVAAPIAMLPLIPMIAPMLGPLETAFACWLGWTIGAVIAFCVARYGGKPLLARFVLLDVLHRYEARIPTEAHFALILALRIVVPVDFLSYALGLFSRVSLTIYTLASALGILWFSLAFSYLGYAASTGNTVLFAGYSVASAIIFLSAFLFTYKTLRTPGDKTEIK